LFLARAVYAFSWYNIGAVLPLVGTGLGIGTVQLGVVLGSFLLGAATFQIPAGLASLRWGSRRVCLAALAVMGVFALASAFSPDWYVLAALRFGAGAGAAFFFAPALGLVATYYPAGTRGPIIGFYNAGFSAGAALGIILGALIGSAYGWQWALAVGGVGLLVGALAASTFLPSIPAPTATRSLSDLLGVAAPVLRSRPLWALALGLTGFWAGFYIVAQYFVEFAAKVHPTWSLAFAASLPTLLILVEIIGGPIGGFLAERGRDMRTILLIFGATAAVAIVLIPFLSLMALLAVFLFLGFADGVVFADLYLIPSYHAEARGEGLALALALINCIQIFAGSALAIAFGFVAATYGYTEAWIFAGVVGILTMPMLIWVRGSREDPEKSRQSSFEDGGRPTGSSAPAPRSAGPFGL
jgi:predicted MFS family arabinose efflux permease